MKNAPIEMDGDLVLSLAASVSTVINDSDECFEHYIDIKDEEVRGKAAKACRRTILHDFIEAVCCEQLTYLMLKHFDLEVIEEMKKWMDYLGAKYETRTPEADDELEHYADDMQSLFNEKALPIISNAVFSVLFQDKDFCYKFNLKIAEQIKQLKKTEYPDILKEDGYMKRSTLPTWLKDGVYYRDKGRCQSCGTDLTKMFVIDNAINYDHIIPLHQGGSNDPTNYQLMCEHCNKSKNDRSHEYRNIIWPVWPDDSEE